jgi:hypothetical protein
MSEAYYTDVRRDALAKLFTASGTGFGGAKETKFDTAEEAFKAAVAALASGKHDFVRVWVEGVGMIDFPQIQNIHDYWAVNPGDQR